MSKAAWYEVQATFRLPSLQGLLLAESYLDGMGHVPAPINVHVPAAHLDVLLNTTPACLVADP